MKNFTKQALALAVVAAFAVTGCKKGSEGSFNRANGAGGPFTGADSVITGNITSSRTLTPGKVYKLNGVVYVTNNAKLTINPGTKITTGEKIDYRETPTSSAIKSIAGVLVITKGAKIDALGTPDQPIVFTAPNAEGNRKAGDFGGVIILGQSTTNKPATTIIEGLPQYDANGNSLGVDITYGGSVPADNSGIFQYVRIEYAGFKLAENNEVNGLTFGGVGSGTTVDHVQVSYGADDAFEFFGGTVKASYLLALANDDDDFDTDFGYSGEIQYAIGLKDVNSTHSQSGGVSDSNGIESDNDGSGSGDGPRTKPTYTNFTLLGYGSANSAAFRSGNRWRRNTDMSISESIIAGYNTGAEFESAGTIASANAGFTNNIVHAYVDVFKGATPANGIITPANASEVANPNTFLRLGYYIDDAQTVLSSPFYSNLVASDYIIANLLPIDQSNTKGAVTAASYNEWTSGWVNFVPQSSVD
jgi:hypothetical protein